MQLFELFLFCIVQVENEAAVQQLKKMKLEHVHAHDQLAEEKLRLQRALAQIQVQAFNRLHWLYHNSPSLNPLISQWICSLLP